jgi:hypothetical protein
MVDQYYTSKKAQRAKVLVAGMEMNVYLMPDATYRLAGRNVTDAIDMEHKSLGRIMGVKSLKALPGADLTLGQVKAETGESFIPVSLEDAITYWGIMATKGNKEALALISALAIESLERRADTAFNRQRTEEEYEFRTELRRKRIVTRYLWTDQIKMRQEEQGYYRDEDGKITQQATDEYRELTRQVNQALFARPHFNCNRDTMTLKQQIAIEGFEELLTRWGAKHPNKNASELVADCLDIYTI